MIIFHIITFSLYLVSIAIYYVFYYLWDNNSTKRQMNEFYISWSIATVLLALAQGVLIYIFWGLSKEWIAFEDKGTEDHDVDADSMSEHRESEVESTQEDHGEYQEVPNYQFQNGTEEDVSEEAGRTSEVLME